MRHVHLSGSSGRVAAVHKAALGRLALREFKGLAASPAGTSEPYTRPAMTAAHQRRGIHEGANHLP